MQQSISEEQITWKAQIFLGNIPHPWLDIKHVSNQVLVELSTQGADDSENLPTWLMKFNRH